ncbi:hypothetical protein BDZ45DRAFT_729551 [Acephala macrosclerotiorum]|nr:hypothetical protein BDZ45DRAFT_729551 [Acephala macrosclerotiorum]
MFPRSFLVTSRSFLNHKSSRSHTPDLAEIIFPKVVQKLLFKMQFNTLLVLTGVLFTLSLADPNPEPQSPAQTSALVSDLESYVQVLATDTAFLAFASAIQTNAPLSSSIASFESSMSSLIAHKETPAPDYLTAVPSEYQGLFSSIYSEEYRIASQDGFLTTSSSQGAAPTGGIGGKVKAAGAVAVGFVGAVALLE